MSSGHPSFGTMHANSVDTMIRRLETPPINLSGSLVETLDVVCVMTQTKLQAKPVRRLREVSEIISVADRGSANINTPFIWDPQKDTFYFKSNSYAFQKLVLHHGLSITKIMDEFNKRTNLLIAMYKKGIFDFKEVKEVINEYYKDPKAVLAKFGLI